jgi:short-subunit dehydrogenase
MKNVRLKKLNEQVVVITGASSGIGLVTARMAADRGARLVVAARNEDALRQLCREIERKGGDAVYVDADVAEEDDIRAIAQAAIRNFGGFDTWINNAGISIYGRIMDVPVEDMRQLFETDFWGVVYGSRTAVEHLRRRGGALINVGSVVSDAAVPLQGIYSASKHAVKGFTDALRMELEDEGAPISVTLIKPTAIDTPFPHHAKTYLGVEPQHAPPVYAPELVAQTILHACENPVRDLYVGEGAKMMSTMSKYAPRLGDKFMEAMQIPGQQSDHPADPYREDALYEPGYGLAERGGHEGHVFESSPYTKAAMHPVLASAVAIGAGLAVTALWRASARERT